MTSLWRSWELGPCSRAKLDRPWLSRNPVAKWEGLGGSAASKPVLVGNPSYRWDT